MYADQDKGDGRRPVYATTEEREELLQIGTLITEGDRVLFEPVPGFRFSPAMVESILNFQKELSV